MDTKQALCFSEFERAVKSSSPLEQLVKTIPLHQVIAAALPRSAEKDPLKIFLALDRNQIELMSNAICDSLKDLLEKHVSELREGYLKQEAIDSSNASKFCISTMATGSIDDFHKGLAGRVGKKLLTVSYMLTAVSDDVYN